MLQNGSVGVDFNDGGLHEIAGHSVKDLAANENFTALLLGLSNAIDETLDLGSSVEGTNKSVGVKRVSDSDCLVS